MLKFYLSFAFFIFSIGLVFAEDVNIDASDSLISGTEASLLLENSDFNWNSVRDAKIYLIKGGTHKDKRKFDQALNYYYKAEALYKSIALNKDKRIATIGEKGLVKCKYSLAYIYSSKNEIDKALYFYFEELDIIQSSYKDFDKEFLNSEVAEAFNSISGCYIRMTNFDKALKYSHQAVKLFELIKPTDDIRDKISRCYNNIGVLYIYTGFYPRAIDYLLKSLKIKEERNDKFGMALIYGNLSAYHFEQGDYKKSIYLNLLSVKIFRELKDSVKLCSAYNNLSENYICLNRMNEALIWCQKSIDIGSRLKFDNENGNILIDCYSSKGRIYQIQKRLSESIVFYEKALDFCKKSGDIFRMANVYSSIAEVNLLLKNFDLVIENGLLAEKYALKAGVEVKENDNYRVLKDAYFAKDDFAKAIKYSDLYIKVKDRMFHDIKNSIDQSVGAKFEIEKKNKELEILKTEYQIKLNTIESEKNKMTVFIFSAILLLVFSVVAYYFIRLKQKANLNKLLLNQQSKGWNAISEAQELERARIARELHDGIGQLLAGVKINLSSLQTHMHTKSLDSVEMYSKSLKSIDEACVNVRAVSHQIMPKSLTNTGIIVAVEELLANSFDSEGIIYELDLHNMAKMPDNIELFVYRILQELFRNVIQHAKAESVILQMYIVNEVLMVLFEDDGIGYKKVKYKVGLGLLNIENQINSINGNFNIEAGPIKGTSVSMRIPLKANNIEELNIV